MQYIKQLNFDITQSRRIRNYIEQHKLSSKEVLKKFKEIIELLFNNWKERYKKSGTVSFDEYLLMYLKYAEFSYRLKERKEDLKKIRTHVNILRDAIEEYERDYKEIITIEKIVNKYFSDNNEN